MTTSMTIECDVHFHRPKKSRKELHAGPEPAPAGPTGRVPRVARFMALALRLERLVRTGVVRNYAELARLGHVDARPRQPGDEPVCSWPRTSRSRLLFLPRTECGRDPVILHDLLPIAATADWRRQRRLWECFRRGGRRGARDRPAGAADAGRDAASERRNKLP